MFADSMEYRNDVGMMAAAFPQCVEANAHAHDEPRLTSGQLRLAIADPD